MSAHTVQHTGEKSRNAFFFCTISCYLDSLTHNQLQGLDADVNCFSPKLEEALSSVTKRHVCVSVADRGKSNAGHSKGDSQACAAIWWSQLGKDRTGRDW